MLVERFFCCISLEVGVVLIAWAGFVKSVVIIITDCVLRNPIFYLQGVTLGISTLYGISCVLLIFGHVHKKIGLFIPWLVSNACTSVVLAVFTPFVGPVGLVFLLLICLQSYFWICVYSQYKFMRIVIPYRDGSDELQAASDNTL